jgi:hypothetical protein
MLVDLEYPTKSNACQFKLQNVQRIIYQDLSSNKFETVFLGISRISAGVHERLIFVFCDRNQNRITNPNKLRAK